jgi:hypothetical protein
MPALCRQCRDRVHRPEARAFVLQVPLPLPFLPLFTTSYHVCTASLDKHLSVALTTTCAARLQAFLLDCAGSVVLGACAVLIIMAGDRMSTSVAGGWRHCRDRGDNCRPSPVPGPPELTHALVFSDSLFASLKKKGL